MSSICLYGGSFDPVHLGHICFAKKIIQRFKPESLFFIPTFYSPFKGKKRHSTNEHRINMLNLACENIPSAQVSLLEIERKGYSYTIDTLRLFKEKYPDHTLYWIIGDDHINTLHHWSGYPEHFDLCEFIVLPRMGEIDESMIQGHAFKDKIHFIRDEQINVSSTGIREHIALNENIDKLVPEEIKNYIQANKLYR